jgi:rRNA processing protein Gar1
VSIGSIVPGDLVMYSYGIQAIGMVLEVIGEFPWSYRVVWNSGEIKEHETGVLRRVWCYGG